MARALLAASSLLYLNLLFSFENIPSTPILRPVARPSLELVLLLAILAGVVALGGRLSRTVRGAVAAILVLLALARYADVTALGVLGREFDLHGDFPHVHRVFQMFWDAMSPAAALLVLGTGIVATILAVALTAGGIRLLERALTDRRLRLAVLALGGVSVAWFVVSSGSGFARTTTSIVARQIGNLRAGEADEIAAREIDWPAQNLDSDLERLEGANVFLIFLESYGVTLIEDAHHFEQIEPRYRALEQRLDAEGYSFRSSQIQSPTFGGGSWRAHASLLSGFHVENEHLYNALLASERESLASVLGARGYRTVAAEPGIKWYWPDGDFYGFDRIYAFDDLDYQGPEMGWWKIPDQYTLYRIYQEEIATARRPVFAKFSLIMSHIPYFPVPDYVEDWSRFDEGSAFDGALKSVAHDAYRDLRELSTWYVEAFRYELDVLEGFLLDYVPENSLTIVVGDHQPPKLVTHDNDSWAVPMHVFSRRPELVAAFERIGFERTLLPRQQSALRMSEFLDRFLELYDSGGPASTSVDE